MVVSLLTPAPSKEIMELVDNLRNPITDDEKMEKYGAGDKRASAH